MPIAAPAVIGNLAAGWNHIQLEMLALDSRRGLELARQLAILTEVFSNRLLDAMREKAGASYSPSVRLDWPTDVDSGGSITGFAQRRASFCRGVAEKLLQRGVFGSHLIFVDIAVLQDVQRRDELAAKESLSMPETRGRGERADERTPTHHPAVIRQVAGAARLCVAPV